MFIDNETESEQACKTAELNKPGEMPIGVIDIKRTGSGSIDTGHYLEKSSEMRSKYFMKLIKGLFGRSS